MRFQKLVQCECSLNNVCYKIRLASCVNKLLTTVGLKRRRIFSVSSSQPIQYGDKSIMSLHSGNELGKLQLGKSGHGRRLKGATPRL